MAPSPLDNLRPRRRSQPADRANSTVTLEQALDPQTMWKPLNGHMRRHQAANRQPSPLCIMFISAMQAVASTPAGQQLEHDVYASRFSSLDGLDDMDDLSASGSDLVRRPTQRLTALEERPVRQTSGPKDSRGKREQMMGSLDQEKGGRHPRVSSDMDDMGGGLSLRRAMTGTLSEYNFPSSMPSPRLGSI